MGDRDGGRDGGRGGRGGRHRIPRRFRNGDGALVGCRVRENPDGPVGGGFMYQNEGEDTYVRTFWKDLDFWDGLMMKPLTLAPLTSMFTLKPSTTAWMQLLFILRLDPSKLATVARADSSTLRKPASCSLAQIVSLVNTWVSLLMERCSNAASSLT